MDDKSYQELEQAVDAVAAMLRALGGMALTNDARERTAIRDTFESWARHISVLAAHPDNKPIAGRDWRGLVQMFVEHRRLEHLRVLDARASATGPVRQPATGRPLLRPQDEAPRPPSRIEPRPADNLQADFTRAIDALVSFLRVLERNPMPGAAKDAPAGRLEAWSRHVAVMSPPPVRLEGASNVRREWTALMAAFLEERVREVNEVKATLQRYSDSLWDVARTAVRSLKGERADPVLDGHLDWLRAALNIEPRPDELKTSVAALIRELDKTVAARQREFESALAQRDQTIRSLAEQLGRLQAEGEQDAFTKLPNRRALDRRLARMDDLDPQRASTFVIIVLTIDRLEEFNQTWGHQFGDEVIVAIADLLAYHFASPSQFAARVTAAEFVVILEDLDLQAARAEVERLLAALRPTGEAQSEALTLSVGLAHRQARETPHACFVRADIAMRESRRRGTGQLTIAE